jgi:putative ABC transport system permease protein
VRYALDAVRRRPGRSFLTALGIGLATALVVILLAVSEGIQTSATRLAAESGVDLIATSTSNDSSPGTGQYPYVPQAHPLTTAIEGANANVATVSPWLVGDLVYGNASLYAAANASQGGSPLPPGWSWTGASSIGWIPSDNTGIEVPSIIAGTGFTAPGDPHYANGTYDGPFTHEIVLDQGLAGVLHVGVGDLVWLGVSAPGNASQLVQWYHSATVFRVVGVSGPFWLIPSVLLSFLYLSEYQTLVGGATPSTDYASLFLIHLFDPTTVDATQSSLARQFPSLTFISINQILGAVQDVVNLYRTFGELIGSIGIVVATLFATTVLLMSVDDRSREIALLRAVGYSRRRVGGLVVEEALWLSALGMLIGLPLAYIASTAHNDFLTRLVPGLPTGFSFVAFDLTVTLAGLLVVLAIGLIASVLPMVRAMQLPVAEELRAP